MRAAYLEHTPIHYPNLLLIIFDPSLRSIHIGILSENTLVPVQYPSVDRNSHTARQLDAIDLCTTRRDLSRHVESNGRADSHRLLQTNLEIRQFQRLVVRHYLRHFRSQDFLHQLVVHASIGEHVPHKALHRAGGTVAASEDCTVRNGENVIVAERVRVLALGFYQAVQEILVLDLLALGVFPFLDLAKGGSGDERVLVSKERDELPKWVATE